VSSAVDTFLWTRPEPGSRRPRFTREKIAAAALAIADAEGFEAVSMRRVAAELGAGTMTLYHYVRNKDELLSLMDDAIMAELLVPDGELPDHWRDALLEIAHRTRAAFKRHRWAIDALRGVKGGPNGMRHFEQSLAALADTGLDAARQVEVISSLDDYVFGFVIREGEMTEHSPSKLDDEALAPLFEYIESLLQSGDFPHMRKLVGEGDVRESWKRMLAVVFDDARFERGVARLLDGIALDIERRTRA
jgi:AcrR family transcriptional regulator